MNYFSKYVSNNLAASSNQTVFIADDEDGIYTSRDLLERFERDVIY